MNRINPADRSESQWARLALEGLSIGDAFGQQFFIPGILESATPDSLPPTPWNYTDDTEMAIAIVRTLEECRRIDRDFLAGEFAARFRANPYRGYGAGARQLLEGIGDGGDWRVLSREMFGGAGSFGNGAAMRIAPLGAWYDNADTVIEQATLSAEVTHRHAEGIAGAIAVALTAWWVKQHVISGEMDRHEDLIPWLTSQLAQSEVRQHLEYAGELDFDTWQFTVASQLGCGEQITAQDTVPYCIWMAAAHLNHFERAMWTAARVGGDIDTNCAIIGGIVALNVGQEGIARHWHDYREPLAW